VGGADHLRAEGGISFTGRQAIEILELTWFIYKNLSRSQTRVFSFPSRGQPLAGNAYLEAPHPGKADSDYVRFEAEPRNNHSQHDAGSEVKNQKFQ